MCEYEKEKREKQLMHIYSVYLDQLAENVPTKVKMNPLTSDL